MEINPYAAPQAEVLQATTEDEQIRREYLNTEATIKSVGILYYLGTVALTAIGVIALTRDDPHKNEYDLLLGMLLIVMGIGMGIAAFGLRRLQNWARPLTILLSSVAVIIGLVNQSWGVVIHVYILAQVLGKRGKFVMTPEYHRVIAATPHVKRKTSVVMKVLLAVLLIILIGVIAANKLNR
ncbi:hypothetical protein [Prosthecobacter sp.]|uniref:hypothetical protein n=1 Tax=Prosthecobacter sp. TaxID=1965333 RepID=UPI003784BCBF